MSNEYYGVASTPMDDFFAHYGVRGMKWGVQKAKHKGTSKAMAKAYKKASEKLEKLNARVNLGNQHNEIKYQLKKAITSGVAGVSAGIAGAGIGSLGSVSPWMSKSEKLTTLHTGIGGLALGAGLTGKAAYHLGKAISAKYRRTATGHAKAIAKRDAWQKEMKSAFKGTQFDASGSVKKKKKRVNV